MQEFLDIIASKGGDSLGGVRFVISNEKATNVLINGEKIKPGDKYWIVTNDYVAEGGDGLDVFSNREKYVKSGNKIRDVIIEYLENNMKEGKEISVELDGRISHG